MNLIELLDVLGRADDLPVNFELPDRTFVPSHFHITEVGHVTKKFIDCGGTLRTTEACSMQLWVANDRNHRLRSKKLLEIIRFSAKLPILDLPVDVEYQVSTISTYSLLAAVPVRNGINLYLGDKETDCLAPDKCGVQGCCDVQENTR